MCFGDMNTLPGSKEVFYCDKGEKCCPKPPQGEECAKICPTYDKEGIISKNSFVTNIRMTCMKQL